MSNINPEYSYSADSVTQEEWTDILLNFDDANIYQSWSYGQINWGKDNLSHLLLKKNKKIVAICQVRIVKFPMLNTGVAYVFRGPLWRLDRNRKDKEIFKQILKALREEYTEKRSLVLKIVFNETQNEVEDLVDILNAEKYKKNKKYISYRTLILGLDRPMTEIRGNFRKKWRYSLKQSEKNNYEIIQGNKESHFEEAIEIYSAMRKFKTFAEYVNINEFKLVQNKLPVNAKLDIIIIRKENVNLSAAIVSKLGDTGILLFAATNQLGRTLNSSYFCIYKVIELLKLKNTRYFDLGGVDPELNPGGYTYKSGIVGDNGNDLIYAGMYDTYKNVILFRIFSFALDFYMYLKKMKSKL